MKRIFSGLMLVMLCVGLLTFTIKIQPVRAADPMPLSVTVTPTHAVISAGQTQIFNSIVTGGSPPFTYQWFDGSFDGATGAYIIPGETNSTISLTASERAGKPLPGWYISVRVTDSVGTTEWSPFVWWWEATWDAPVYYSVEPVPVAPLANVNVSINGLETPSAPSPVGQNFTVEIHLRNATATNIPFGVAGLEIHFYFDNILDYCKPVGFTDELGQPGNPLPNPIYAVNGFYNGFPTEDNVPLPSPYTNATRYIVAAASTTGPWNGDDGVVAKITFQITGQPSQNMSQPDFYAQMQIGYGDVMGINFDRIALSVAQGTLRIDSAGASSLVGDLNGDGIVNLLDLQLLANAYNSKPGDRNWNQLADIASPYGIVSLTDLVTLAMHYGQHYP